MMPDRIELKVLSENFPDIVSFEHDFRGELTMSVQRDHIVDVCNFLKSHDELRYVFLSDLTAVDCLGLHHHHRFEVIYHLYSFTLNERLRLKVSLQEGQSILSVTPVWSGANWMEREVYDLFGIEFLNHPDLRRILLTDNWDGHPLRKDYDLRGPRAWKLGTNVES